MCCFCGRIKMARTGLTPENGSQKLSRGGGVDLRKELSNNGVEDTNGPSISGNHEPTRIHWTSDDSALQDQIQDFHPFRNVPSSGPHTQLPEVWTDNGNPSSTVAENGSLRDAAIAQSENSNTRTSNSYPSSSRRPPSSEAFRVPYIFEFVPFPGHTCTGRGTIPLSTVTVSVEGTTEDIQYFKYDSSFQRLLNIYNYQNRRVFANEPVELRHVTEVSLQGRVEFSASVRLARSMREKKVLVVTLLKRYPGCPECRSRGRLHDDPPS
jgi:hypothetical protein